MRTAVLFFFLVVIRTETNYRPLINLKLFVDIEVLVIAAEGKVSALTMAHASATSGEVSWTNQAKKTCNTL